MTFAKESEETKKRNEELREKKSSKSEKEQYITDGKESDFSHKRIFTWEGLNYHVPVAGGQLRLLHDVLGYVKPGTLTALMGASGAGKTTCLDVLAQRKNIGVISGDILVGTFVACQPRPFNLNLLQMVVRSTLVSLEELHMVC